MNNWANRVWMRVTINVPANGLGTAVEGQYFSSILSFFVPLCVLRAFVVGL